MATASQKKVLTDRGILALKPAESGKRYIVWDAAQPHFGVRVTSNGAKTFIVVKRRPGEANPDTHVLGRYPAIGLKAAREAAPGIVSLLAAGKSPAEAKAEEIREAARRRADTFSIAAEKFVQEEAGRGLRTARATEAVLRREFLGQVPIRKRTAIERGGQKVAQWETSWADGEYSVWRNIPILDIKRRDIIERLDEIKARGGKYAARHALNAVRKLFGWAEEGERFGLEESPAARIRDKTIGISGRDLKRKRVLDDLELRDVWLAADTVGYPFGSLVKMLMLTGQRLNDLARARRREFDEGADLLRVSFDRFKTDVVQEVPLAPIARSTLGTLPKFEGEFLFSTSAGRRPLGGFSKMKARLDATINDQRRREGGQRISHWVLHDLRRTVRTRLTSDLDVDAYIAERVIGHALPGLHGVYDQGAHRQQKRSALQKWESHLLEIVRPKSLAPLTVMDGINDPSDRNRA